MNIEYIYVMIGCGIVSYGTTIIRKSTNLSPGLNIETLPKSHKRNLILRKVKCFTEHDDVTVKLPFVITSLFVQKQCGVSFISSAVTELLQKQCAERC